MPDMPPSATWHVSAQPGQIEELFRHLEGAVEHRLRNLVVHHLIHGRSKKRMLATDYSLIDAVGLLH